MIQGKEAWDWRRDVVSSELDADKMDYLLRDSYFTGVKYGEYDLEKVIESFLIDTNETETALSISSKGIYALEQLLLARYHMTQQVYWRPGQFNFQRNDYSRKALQLMTIIKK